MNNKKDRVESIEEFVSSLTKEFPFMFVKKKQLINFTKLVTTPVEFPLSISRNQSIQTYWDVQLRNTDRSNVNSLHSSPGGGKTYYLNDLAESAIKDHQLLPVLIAFNEGTSFDSQEENDPQISLFLRILCR